METRKGNGASDFQCNMVRGAMETAIANAKGFEGFDRTSFDLIMQEQDFQRSGVVDESQIMELGKIAGVQYILVTEVTAEDGYLYILAKLLDVETGKYGKAYDNLCEAKPTAIRKSCLKLCEHLFDVTLAHHNASQNDKENVDNSDKNTNAKQPNSKPSATTKVGDFKTFSDGTQGVVFYIENGKSLAVSLSESELPWDISRKRSDIMLLENIGENSHHFIYGQGKSNTQIIVQTLGVNATAASWCQAIGTEWYFPSSSELYYLIATAKKDKELGNKLGLDGWYWTSTEHDKKEAINISKGGFTATENKDSEIKVRAIRAFTE